MSKDNIFEDTCTVTDEGTIHPTFDIGNEFSRTSGYLKYFNGPKGKTMEGKRIKVTIEILDDEDNEDKVDEKN